MYKLSLDKKVKKFLTKCDKYILLQFQNKTEELLKDPFNFKNNLDIRPLTGKPKNHFRLRISKYRFIYEVIDDKLFIYFYDADSRGDIYK